ncbi:NAD(P)H-flavin reductase/hemoglobin-like flavoprotein [Actinoplanes lutulentus]|uniref:NAD(P)H-flavin reductase n=1 Tax=Actinoplanes lutulentus TaxID=1287878 RepID=A0A327ZH67_9ACTN|nr:flavohemoprotein [Actinoplanes lutulentus]MBB2941413.1 NAD(P)H-flavin reductase/hemoglobin-like flavoprotein [Actinoplanes lutulentus]RAK36904.1 NAD(P)H-flavin reductase [Actinoplanes lutulentus]
MSAGSGQGSDPHLLALLRAIRLRQNAPDAAAAGTSDTAAALSEIAAQKRAEHREGPTRALPESDQPHMPGSDRSSAPGRPGTPGRSSAPNTPAPVAISDIYEMSVDSADFRHATAGTAVPSSPKPDASPLGGELSPESSFPDEPGAHPSRIHPTPPPRPAPPNRPPADRQGPGNPNSERPNSELLWRGDPATTLGRSNLGAKPGKPPQPNPARRPTTQKGVWGAAAGRINPITGVNPSGPATPAPPIPGLDPVRPIGSPGTEFPQDPSLYAYPPRTPQNPPPRKAAPGVDGMNPADDAELRDTQRLLSTSLTFAGGTEDVADRLWVALYQAQPDLLATLPGTDEIQRLQLARALTWLAHNLDNPPHVVSGCGDLGAALAECGVQWNQLQLVGAALAEAMRAGMAPGAWRQDFDHAWRWTWQHTYEWIVHGGTLAAYQPTAWGAEVISHELRRPDLAVIRVRPFMPMPYRPGQYARIEVADQPGVWRPFSLAGAPHRDETLELHVRARSSAGVSHTLVHKTRKGDHIRLTRAEGDMRVPEEAGRGVLMIAGDTGIAAMKAMLAQVAATADPRPVVLFWGVRDISELYDIDDLSAIALQAPKAKVVPVVSEGNPGPYAYGQVTDAVAAYGEWSRHEVCVAGPPLMVAATTAALEHLRISPARIHHDPPD